MKIKNRTTFWLAAFVVACISIPFLLRTSAQTSPTEDVPLVRLIVAPEKYQGQRVRFIGFVRLEFEGDVVYLHQEDYRHSILGNGIWIDVPDNLSQQAKNNRNMKYCIIEGTFDAKSQGHMSLWSGSIKNINRFEVWSDPAKSRR